jgi:hypothetical protein
MAIAGFDDETELLFLITIGNASAPAGILGSAHAMDQPGRQLRCVRLFYIMMIPTIHLFTAPNALEIQRT